jgi:hypothetical protein
MTPYPTWVCTRCGERYGRRAPTEPGNWHTAVCGVCRTIARVTPPVAYGHLHPDWRERQERFTMGITPFSPTSQGGSA